MEKEKERLEKKKLREGMEVIKRMWIIKSRKRKQW